MPRTGLAGRRRESMSSVCVESTGLFEHPSPASVPVTMAPPNIFGGRPSAMDARCSGSLSPQTTASRDDGPQASPRELSQNQAAEESPLDRNKELLHGHGLPRIVPFENSESHILLRNAPAERKVLRDRNSSQHNFAASHRIPLSLLNQDSSASSKTSSLSSGAAPSTSYTPMTPIEEGRTPISLPPLSTVALGYSPQSTQSNNSPFNLPPPLHSPFLMSPASGKNLSFIIFSYEDLIEGSCSWQKTC